MRPSSAPSEIWVQLHYRYKDESYKYNLPLPQGGKFLDGIRVDFNRRAVPGGHRITVTMETIGPVHIESFVLTGKLDYGDNLQGVFMNGCQSWTGSRERSAGERIAKLNWPAHLFALQQAGDSRFFPYSEKKGRFHGYGYGYLRWGDRIFLAGSLDERIGCTVISTDIRHNLFVIDKSLSGFRLDKKTDVLDMLLIEGSESFVFDRYAAMRSEIHSEMRLGEPLNDSRPLAWISPAEGTRRIDEVSLRRRLAAFREAAVPLDYFAVGRGWYTALGDWNTPAPGFPSGMSSLATEIRGSGYIPGIWSAPFVASVDSEVFRTRKDWLARENGRVPRPAGRPTHQGVPFFALNLFRSDVKQYIAESYRRMRDQWSFDFFILDYLYAAALCPPEGSSRGGAMNAAMDFLSSLKKNETWLCGAVPIECAFGRTEYCRIGADTTRRWENRFLRGVHVRERASTVNALRSTIGRRQLNGRFFINAVDSFILRCTKRTMDSARRCTQLLIHLLFGGFLSISEDISECSPDEKRLFFSLFPMARPLIETVRGARRTITVTYTVQNRRFMSFSNLSERMRSFTLPEGRWFGTPGPRRRAHHIIGGRRQYLRPGESRSYLQLSPEDPFAGSDGHFFPGFEIDRMTSKGPEWTITPKPGLLKTFRIWLKVPEPQSPASTPEPGEPPSGARFAPKAALPEPGRPPSGGPPAPKAAPLPNPTGQIRINGRPAELIRTPAGDLLATAELRYPQA